MPAWKGLWGTASWKQYNITISMLCCWLTLPSTTTSSDLPDARKAPHTMRKGPTFPPVSWMQQSTNLLVSHQHDDELGHGHHSGKGWTWAHQKVLHEASADGSSSGACVPIRGVGGVDHAPVWGIWHLSDSCYQTCLDRASRNTTTSSPEQLYPDSRRWEKPVTSHDSDKGTVFPLCGRPQPMPMCLSIALPGSRTRRKTLEMPLCDTPVFLDIALWDSPRPDNWTMGSRIPGGILAGMIATLFKIAIYAQRQHTAKCILYKCNTILWNN